jgi:hypothetical protein
MIPKYIKLAHWLHEQGKPIALTEVAKHMGVSLSGVYHYISSIRKCADIFQIKINQICMAKKDQYAIRVLSIRPYKLIRGRRPILRDDLLDYCTSQFISMDDMWKQLVSRPWKKLQLNDLS